MYLGLRPPERGLTPISQAALPAAFTATNLRWCQFALQAIPGGSHPPLQHVPPPRMTNGSPPVHAPPDAGGDAGGGIVDAGGALLHTMPGGSHPPLQQVPPPRMTNGSGVAHAAGFVFGGGVVGGVVVGGGVVGGGVVPPTKLHVMPGGSQPPLQHVPPPIATNGSPPTHAAPEPVPPVGGGGVSGVGGGASWTVAVSYCRRSCTSCLEAAIRRYSTCLRPSRRTGHRRHRRHLRWAVAPVAAVPSIRAVVACPPTKLHIMPGGNQPPLQHVPPPIATNGSPPTHAIPDGESCRTIRTAAEA